jgi:hypothetical protein
MRGKINLCWAAVERLFLGFFVFSKERGGCRGRKGYFSCPFPVKIFFPPPVPVNFSPPLFFTIAWYL